MERKRLTQLFPWLMPLRKKQRLFCFYMSMDLDRNHYATKQPDTLLPYRLFASSCPMYNRETGFDMIYQENKVFNLKLAAKPLNHLVIRPGETFSFWKTVRYADKDTPYKDGLAVSNGTLQISQGGGLCQISNLLFWLFLHTPLTIVERQGHKVKDFPEPSSDAPIGVDATVSEGWIDLRVKNDTDYTFQIVISFDDNNICGKILTDIKPTTDYKITNGQVLYYQNNGKIFEEADVIQRIIDIKNNICISSKILYRNRCEIGYQLPDEIIVNEKTPEISFKERIEQELLCKTASRKRIAVLFGGCSPEYNVSLQSSYAVISNMNTQKYIPVPIGITKQGDWYFYYGDYEDIISDTWHHSDFCVPVTVSLSRPERALLLYRDNEINKIYIDAAFPVLHGKNGEDGTVQGVFELADIPVIGCGVLSSALCMDKYRAHNLVKAVGITVPKSYVLKKSMDAQLALSWAEEIGYPLFVKPVKAGSSFGITKVSDRNTLPSAVKLAFEYDDTIIIEENIEGVEIGCAIMGNDILTIGELDEIELADGFFDYTEKYSLTTSVIHVPARINSEKREQIRLAAQKIYSTLDCSGFARVDMFLSASGEIVFNEVNTIPGFTSHSRFPNMMKEIGIPFEQMIETVVEQAVKA